MDTTPRTLHATAEDLIVRERIVINARTAFQEIREQATTPGAHPATTDILLAGEQAFVDAALDRYDWAVEHPARLVERNWMANHTLGQERLFLFLY